MFYAVRAGRHCGICEKLETLKDGIMNFKGAEFNEFGTLEAADIYIASYAGLYADTMLPAPDANTVFLQNFCQRVEPSKWFCGTACFNSSYIAFGDKLAPEMHEAVALLEFLKRVPDDDDKQYTVVVATYMADDISAEQVSYPCKTELGAGSFIAENLELKSDDDELLKVVDEIKSVNNNRKHPVVLTTIHKTEFDTKQFQFRCAMCAAAQVVARGLATAKQTDPAQESCISGSGSASASGSRAGSRSGPESSESRR